MLRVDLDMDEGWFGVDEAMAILRSRLASRRSRILNEFQQNNNSSSSSSSSASSTARISRIIRTTAATNNPHHQPKTKSTYPKNADSDMGDGRTAELEEVKQKLRQAQDENVKLQAVITDITQVNKRWQRYNTDRQMYVQKLLTTIQDQQVQINNMGEQKAFSAARQGEVWSEICDRSECSAIRDELKKMTEKVQLLEFQVKAHRDDWEAERNEKREIARERDDTKAQLQRYIYTELNASKDLSLQESCAIKNGCHYCKNYNIICKPEQNNYLCAAYSTGAAPYSSSSSSSSSSVAGIGQITGQPAARWLRCEPTAEMRELQCDGEELDGDAATSYSRSSTAPLKDEAVTTARRSSSSSGGGGGGAAQMRRRTSASASASPSPPPTNTRQPIVCPGCSRIFPPENNLNFLDHFETCRRS